MEEFQTAFNAITLYQLVVYLDDKQVIYYRSYNSIIEVLGAIGGLFEVFKALFAILVVPINIFLKGFYITNRFYRHKKESQEDSI